MRCFLRFSFARLRSISRLCISVSTACAWELCAVAASNSSKVVDDCFSPACVPFNSCCTAQIAAFRVTGREAVQAPNQIHAQTCSAANHRKLMERATPGSSNKAIKYCSSQGIICSEALDMWILRMPLREKLGGSKAFHRPSCRITIDRYFTLRRSGVWVFAPGRMRFDLTKA